MNNRTVKIYNSVGKITNENFYNNAGDLLTNKVYTYGSDDSTLLSVINFNEGMFQQGIYYYTNDGIKYDSTYSRISTTSEEDYICVVNGYNESNSKVYFRHIQDVPNFVPDPLYNYDSRTLYEYTSEGRLNTAFREAKNLGMGGNSFRAYYYFLPEIDSRYNFVDSQRFVYYTNDEFSTITSENLEIYSYTLNSEGLPIQAIVVRDDEPLLKYVWEYDENGYRSYSMNYDYNSVTWVETNEVITSYDDEGRILSEQNNRPSDVDPILDKFSLFEYAYNTAGYLTMEKTSYGKRYLNIPIEDWYVSTITRHYRNEFNNLDSTREETYNVYEELGGEIPNVLVHQNFINYYYELYEIPTSLQDESLLNKFVIYPNPSNSKLYINNDQNISASIVITNINGQKVMEVSNNNISLQTIDVSNLSNGLYFITFYTKTGETYTDKFIKQ